METLVAIKRRASAVLFVQALLLTSLLGLGLCYPVLGLDAPTVIYPLCCLILLNTVWSLWSWSLVKGSWFDCYSVFLIAASLFNGGQAFLEVFHLNHSGLLDNAFSPATTMRTLYVVLLGLSAMHMGALAGTARTGRGLKPADLERASSETLGSLRWVGGALLLVSMPFTFMMLKNEIGIVLSGGYFALYQQQAATGLDAGPAVLASFLTPGALFLLAGSSPSKKGRLVAVIVIAGYAMSQLFLGVRHEAAILAVEVAWLWHRLVWPIRRTALLGGAALIVGIIFPLIAATRDTSGQDRASVGYLAENYVSMDNPLVASLGEMGGSMGTVAHTIDLVPRNRDYEMGAGYGYALLTLVPNLFWKIDPTIAHELPSTWLTWQIDPYTASQGGGLGYSFIAEAYMNFGLLGVPCVLLLGGFVFGKFVTWADQGRKADRLAFIASAACFATFLVRAEAAVVTRGVVWYAIVPYLLVTWITSARRSRALGHHGLVEPIRDFARVGANIRPES